MFGDETSTCEDATSQFNEATHKSLARMTGPLALFSLRALPFFRANGLAIYLAPGSAGGWCLW